MKKQRLHTLPLETIFLRKIQAGVQYFNQNHYTNFNRNSLEIRTFNSSPENEYWPTDSIFEKVLKALSLHNVKHLTKLSISIKASFIFKTSTLRHFAFTLARQFKTLKQLDLRFLSCKELNGEKMRYLLDSLTKGMNCLTEVNLHLLGCTDIGDQCLEDIKLFIMKRCKRLQRFKVIISGYVRNMSDVGFVYFESDIDRRLQSSHTLSGCATGDDINQITSKGGASLCRGIARYLRNLRSLTFKLASLQQENDIKLSQDILKMICGLSNLEHLNFSSSYSLKVDDEYLLKITSSIGQKLKNLQSLSLDFPGTIEITDGGCQQLARNFFLSLPSELRYFAFSLEDSTSITDATVIGIGFNIAKNLKDLQTLILSFCSAEKLTGNGVYNLTEQITLGLPTLKKLVLGFGWCEEVNQNSLFVLPKRIEQFDLYLYRPKFWVHETWKNLHRLSLYFELCQEKNSFLDLFSERNFTLKSLNELKLIYSRSGRIEDKEIRELVSEIGTKLANLTSLELGFSECPLLTSESLLLFGDKICRKLKKLRHLNFSFFHAGDFSNNLFIEGGIRYLTGTITSKLKDLESLTLSFHGSLDEEMDLKEVFEDFCIEITQNLKKLKKLSLMFDIWDNLELKRKIREKLCHIPMLYID